jgi:hypothetical protein
MAITLTTLNGTDSIAASRITINDNFATIGDALNEVLSIIDIATGKIDNYNFGGSNPSIETGDVIIHGTAGSGGINVLSGNIIAQNGNIVIGGVSGSGYLEMGLNSGVKIQRFTKNLSVGNIPIMDFSGSVGALGTTGSTGTIGYLTLPRQPLSTIEAIQNPQLGAVVFDSTNMEVLVCTGTTSASGATGTWTAL